MKQKEKIIIQDLKSAIKEAGVREAFGQHKLASIFDKAASNSISFQKTAKRVTVEPYKSIFSGMRGGIDNIFNQLTNWLSTNPEKFISKVNGYTTKLIIKGDQIMGRGQGGFNNFRTWVAGRGIIFDTINEAASDGIIQRDIEQALFLIIQYIIYPYAEDIKIVEEIAKKVIDNPTVKGNLDTLHLKLEQIKNFTDITVKNSSRNQLSYESSLNQFNEFKDDPLMKIDSFKTNILVSCNIFMLYKVRE